MKRLFWSMFGLGLLMALSSSVAAQKPVTENDVLRVAKQLYCPVCPNTPLDVCETQACQDWRELIRQRLQVGDTDQQIINYFVNQYGPRVLTVPPTQGFSLLGWIVPILGITVGVVGLTLLYREWLRRSKLAPKRVITSVPDTLAELPVEYVKRLEQELEEFKE
jgi:cytochrome c-type biogenesis protein CcmH